MRKLTTSADLAWALKQPSGLLINMYSNNGVHAIHRLPLKQACRGNLMRIISSNPKYYASAESDLTTRFGQQGCKWNFCHYC